MIALAGVESNKPLPSKLGKVNVVSLGLEEGHTLHDVVRKRKTEKLKQPTLENMMKKQEKELLDDYVALFFCTSRIFSCSL